MATPTYTLIDSTTLTSSAGSVTFTSIPQTYGDLRLVVNHNSTSGNYTRVELNSGGSYSYVVAYGNGSTASSDAYSGYTQVIFDPVNQQTWLQGTLDVMDYSVTNKHKTMLSRADHVNATLMGVWRWASTAAVTSIKIVNPQPDLPVGTTIYLYGIEA